MDKNLIRSLFEYKDGHLFWKNSVSNVESGSRAGTVCDDGYIRISINKKKYREHRLIWAMFNGKIAGEIDHKNRNRSDNRIENLRDVSHSDNILNSNFYTGETGERGISINGSGYRVRIQINGVRKTLGTFKTLSDAIKARDEFTIK